MRRICFSSFDFRWRVHPLLQSFAAQTTTGPITQAALSQIRQGTLNKRGPLDRVKAKQLTPNFNHREKLGNLIQLTTEWKLTSPRALEMRKEMNFPAMLHSEEFSAAFREFLEKYEDYLIACEGDLRANDIPIILMNIKGLFPDFLFSTNLLKILSSSLTEEEKWILKRHARQFQKYKWLFGSCEGFAQEKEKIIQSFMENKECILSTEEAKECFFRTWLVHCIWIRQFGNFMEEWSDSAYTETT